MGGRLREQRERADVARADHGEVPVVEGGDLVDIHALGQGDDGGVAGAKGKVGVLLDEISHPGVVGRGQLDCDQVAVAEGPQEESFGPCAGLGRQEVADLGHDRGGQHHLAVRQVEAGEQLHATVVVRVFGEGGRNQGAGVANDHVYRPKPSRSSSSLCAPTAEPSPSAIPNHAGGHGRSLTGCRCLRTSASTSGTWSSGRSWTRRISSSRSPLMESVYDVEAAASSGWSRPPVR